MIWLTTVSLAAGGLLALRFKIVVLAPATFLVVLVAVSVGAPQASRFWLSISTVASATVGIQVGYFLGILLQYGLGALFPPKSSITSAAKGGDGAKSISW